MRIAVIGLGYVGMPLAVALSRRFSVLGFDVDASRVAELKAGHDRTAELSQDALSDLKLALSCNQADLAGHDVFIITVPTPVDASCQPDLSAVRSACRSIAKALRKGSIVVLESTVYPGVTEDVCGAEL